MEVSLTVHVNAAINIKDITYYEEIKRKFEVPGRNEVPGGDEGLGERLSSKVRAERWDLIPGEESKFDDGRGKLVTFSCLQ